VPRLSIIIPTLGDWDSLETTLVTVLRNRPPRCEVIVVLDQTYQDPYDLKEEVRFVEVPGRGGAATGRAGGRAGLVELVNAGFAAARCELLHVLVCGATVGDGWADGPLRRFDSPRVAAVAPLVLDAEHPEHIFTAGCTWSPGGNVHSFGRGLPADAKLAAGPHWIGPEFVAGFYRRSTLAQVGALDATLPPDLAAVDLNLQLLAAGAQTVLEPACRLAVASDALRPCRPLIEAWHRERLFWRYAGRHARLTGLAAHACVVSLETMRYAARPSGFARAIGRLLGACDRRPARRTELHADGTGLPHADIAPAANGVERRVDAAHVPHVPRELRPAERAAGMSRKSVNLSSGEKSA
jgi:GT2 family glycosyltransferase